jgi:hypothetical protein
VTEFILSNHVKPTAPLVAALSDYIASHIAMSPYAWKVGGAAWRTLGTGFDHQKYSDNLPRQNIALKLHLAEHWASSLLNEKLRISKWIVKDWGGINRNSDMKILGYVNQADAERPATPFDGISSYSKIFGIKDPLRYAIYDARVAASLNAIQLLLMRERRLQSPDMLAFSVPLGRNQMVNLFCSTAFPVALTRLGFIDVERDAIFGIYLAILSDISSAISKSILEVEMYLFAEANELCRQALASLHEAVTPA